MNESPSKRETEDIKYECHQKTKFKLTTEIIPITHEDWETIKLRTWKLSDYHLPKNTETLNHRHRPYETDRETVYSDEIIELSQLKI